MPPPGTAAGGEQPRRDALHARHGNRVRGERHAELHQAINAQPLPLKSAMTRLFSKLIGRPGQTGDSDYQFGIVSADQTTYELLCLRSKRCWRTVCYLDYGVPLYRIEEFTPFSQQGIQLEKLMAMAAPLHRVPAAQAQRGAERRGFQTAALPPTACSVCGKTPAKFCAICNGPAYCDKACQVADWSNHKKDPACKAARAAAKAAAAGPAA